MKLILVAICLVLSGCASKTVRQYHDYTQPNNSNTVTIKTTFTTIPDVECKMKTVHGGDTLGCVKQLSSIYCNLVVVRPSNENDTFRNTILGHELMHCFGAKHE